MDDSQGQGGPTATPISKYAASPADRARRFRDPFSETTDPAIYVPRPASEAAIEAAAACLDAEAPAAAILGPPGIGKTLLLQRTAAAVSAREVQQRGVEVRTVQLPYSAVSFDDWCAWVLGKLGETAAPSLPGDPVAALESWIAKRRMSGPRLLVCMDEAGALPLDTARHLHKLMAPTGRGLRLVLAATEDAQASRVLSVLGDVARVVRLTTPMTPPETARYVLGRLDATATPDVIQARFDADALDWIHTVSAGIPRRVHEIARSLIETPPQDVGRAWWEDRWLGAPIEEATDAILDLDETLPGPL